MGKYIPFPSKSNLDTDRLEPLLPPEPIHRIWLSRVYLFTLRILAITGVTVLFTMTLYKYFFSITSFPSPPLYTTSLRTIPPIEIQQMHSAYGVHCGNSPVEARRLGCRFDMINFSWQRADCWDETLYTRFLAQYTNIWHWETPGGDPVPLDEVLAGLHQALYTTWDFYIVHCLYVVEQAVRKRQLLYDEWSPPHLHAKQCMLDLRDTGKHAPKTMMISVKMWYPACEPELANGSFGRLTDRLPVGAYE
ncbi:hypothetical protein AJ78_00740 [Emergomyces pasteurianus Ep9510]|uniref:Uncharacterized protein n=1 Tax=Emergomyces pasteurianus Ep9510 TaxID=1447872 RepID=A0A1J9QGG6_9EURO|nr:hypothetical protein AJ78_00740 [Emergomyces pasteurianus Ep9510]